MMRRVEHGSRAFQAPVDVHASADGQIYLFKRRQNESAVSSDDEDHVVMDRKPQVCQNLERNIQFLEREVLDGDTLNKLALQYGCKVADIKRLNNLMQEQDFYALKSVRIPVQKHSFLGETSTILRDHKEDFLHSAAKLKPLDTSRTHRQPKEVSDFVMDVEQDTERLIQSANDPDETKQPRFIVREGSLSKADCGAQWWNVVVAVLVIGIILPVFFLLFFKMKNSHVLSSADTTTQPSGSFSNASTLTPVTAAGGD
ncbi:lysM and putative peptidoglycan-binding domain-containing protein 4 isoform X1 [Takifugu flavidus]|uniref:LysM and putative peptidoglycan-binding domain-containing protein 4 n=1 Tax=Takifugu flavidus TaxID=433684 RepID=A0A5C6PAA6_9TELE|nr:lysM and putative peptidoglycan-binding domain-containing protein 4 isoform X1 [Takifugu flavidus]TWW76355.1 LysM and putative peptidoglycan-binding domain-containing protein 4 [Takifugu flavidus]